MNTIRKTVSIKAGHEAVHDALTLPEAYRGWWSKNSAIATWVGGESTLHFIKEGQPVTMRFRVDELDAHHIRWTCVANNAEIWVGTTLGWSLEGKGDKTEISFEHDGWSEAPPQMVADTWQYFLESLKAYVETGTGNPW